MQRRNGRESPPATRARESLIDGGVTLHADIRIEGSLVFHGTLVGNLRVSETVYVGPQATVEGDIEAAEVRIEGRVVGDVRAKERVDLLPGARLEGDVHTHSLRIEEGAVLRGTSFHGGDAWGEDEEQG